MKLLEIEIHGLKHFNLSNIKSLKAIYTEALQLIIGSNGSGKTRLMRQLTPMPPEKKDYFAEGERVQHYEHEGQVYILRSQFGRENYHSFIRAGVEEEELNPGHTSTVQKQLVEEVLGFTADMQKILTGELKFTSMPPAKVMNLLMSIANLDLDYALKIHDRVKKQLSETNSVLKHVTAKLEEADSNLKNTDESTDEQVEKLRRELKDIYPYTGHEFDQSKIDDIRRSAETIKQIKSSLPKNKTGALAEYDSAEQMQHLLQSLESQLTAKKQECDYILRELDDKTRSLRKAEAVIGQHDVKQVTARNAEITEALEEYDDVELDESDLTIRLNRYNGLSSALTEARNLTADPDFRYYTTEEISQVIKEYEFVRGEHEKNNSTLFRFRESKRMEDHHREHSLSCDSCGNVVHRKEAMGDKEYQSLCETVTKWENALAGDKEKLDALKKAVDDTKEFQSIFNKVFSKLSPYADLFAEFDFTVESFFAGASAIDDRLTLEYQILERKIQKKGLVLEQEELKKVLDVIESSDYDSMSQREASLQDDMLRCNESIVAISHQADVLRKRLTMYNTYQAMSDKATGEARKIIDHFNDVSQQLVSRYASEMIQRREESLALLLTRQDSRKRWMARRDEAMADHDKYKTAKVELEILLKALSPKVGIIADQMSIFLGEFFSIVNTTLSRVFDYDIQIDVAADGSSTLDYKFPLKVEGGDSGEVSTASDGQKDVIDFAFNLALMEVKGLSDYPLYLDEVGRTFDEAHRENFVRYISGLLETDQVSQIFMISHFTSMHGGLSNYESTVLHSDNLTTLPKDYNSHLQLS